MFVDNFFCPPQKLRKLLFKIATTKGLLYVDNSVGK